MAPRFRASARLSSFFVNFSAFNVSIRKSPVGSGTLNAKVTVENLENHSEQISVQTVLTGLPAGCEITVSSGPTTDTLRRLGKQSFQFTTTITCAASTVPGDYTLTLQASVIHLGSGVEQNPANNTATITSILRIH